VDLTSRVRANVFGERKKFHKMEIEGFESDDGHRIFDASLRDSKVVLDHLIISKPFVCREFSYAEFGSGREQRQWLGLMGD
jgi:hypothetical protein